MDKKDEKFLRAMASLTNKAVNHNRPDLREDVEQEAFISGAHALTTWKRDKGYSKKSWVLQHMRRDVVRFLESENLHVGDQFVEISGIIDSDHYEELIDLRAGLRIQNQSDLHKVLDSLPDEQKDIAVMYFFEDISYKDIAERKSLTKQAVYRIVNDALTLLRDRFVVTF